MNIAEALERDRWPLYFVELDPARPLARLRLHPGALMPGTLAVRPGTEPRPWETVRELLEEA